MARLCLVIALITLVPASGCRTHTQKIAPDQPVDLADGPIPDYCREPNWIDNYPMLRGVVSVTGLTLLAVTALALYATCAVAAQQADKKEKQQQRERERQLAAIPRVG